MGRTTRKSIACHLGWLWLATGATGGAAERVANDGRWRSLETDPLKFYEKYDAYPSYCSTPEAMAERRIPPLQVSAEDVNSTLVHLTSIIRHGARTPATAGSVCWEGYQTSPETAQWDCDLTTTSQGLTPSSAWSHEPSHVLFVKTFDALHYSENGFSSNELNGTCQVGQLISQGVPQQVLNGQYLKETYLDASSDPRLQLQLSIPSDVYFRSDDEQRTLLSGQILLQALLHDEAVDPQTTNLLLTHHVADYSRDVLFPNTHVCPKLLDLWEQARESDEFQSAFVTGATAVATDSMAESLLGAEANLEEFLDCYMTTICTDRPLPNVVNDYNQTDSAADKFADYAIRRDNFHLVYNNAAFSKLGMAPLWKEIISHFLPLVQQDLSGGSKFALYSGHDSTIQPLLASLGTNVWDGTTWAPYASLLNLEIHHVDFASEAYGDYFPQEYAFRLIFNGEVLTSRVEGCKEDIDLCDLDVLLQYLATFVGKSWDCEGSGTTELDDDDVDEEDVGGNTHFSKEQLRTDVSVAKEDAQQLVSTEGGIFLIVLGCLCSAILGSVLTCIIIRRQVPSLGRASGGAGGAALYDRGIPSGGMGEKSTMNGASNHHHDDDDDGESDLPPPTNGAALRVLEDFDNAIL